jgi:hypothetical protein
MGARAVDETDHRATEPAATIPGVWLLTRSVVPSPTTRTKTWVRPKDEDLGQAQRHRHHDRLAGLELNLKKGNPAARATPRTVTGEKAPDMAQVTSPNGVWQKEA